MLIQELFTDPIFFLRIILIVITSVCLHELAHGWMAINQGDDTPQRSGHMTLNPVVHMGWESIIFLCLAGIAWGQMPVNPSQFRHPKISNVLVSLAGPFLNLGLAILFVVILKLELSIFSNPLLSPNFLWLGAYINLNLFIFNLLPIPPLDGFHVCSEFFPQLKPLEQTPFGLFAFAILFTSGFSAGIAALSNAVLYTMVPPF